MRLRRRPKGRVGDVVPVDATEQRLMEMYGDDGYEVVAFRELLRRMAAGQAAEDIDDEGKVRVGENFYDYAAGEISGRELCEREGLAGFPAPNREEDEVSENQGPIGGDAEEEASGPTPVGSGLPAPDPQEGATAESEAAQGRRDLEAALSGGDMTIDGLFDASDQERDDRGHRIAGHMHVRAALLALPGIGETKADRILAGLGLDGSEHVDQLGTNERDALKSAIEDES